MGILITKFVHENPRAGNIMTFDFADWVDECLGEPCRYPITGGYTFVTLLSTYSSYITGVTTPIKDTLLSTWYTYGAYGRRSRFLSSSYWTITSFGIAWKRLHCFVVKGFTGTFPDLVHDNGSVDFFIAYLSFRELLMNCLVSSIKWEEQLDSELSCSNINKTWNWFPKMDPTQRSFSTFSTNNPSDLLAIFHHASKHSMMWSRRRDISKRV